MSGLPGLPYSKDVELLPSAPSWVLQARTEVLRAAPSGLTRFTKQTVMQGRTSTLKIKGAASKHDFPGIRPA